MTTRNTTIAAIAAQAAADFLSANLTPESVTHSFEIGIVKDKPNLCVFSKIIDDKEIPYGYIEASDQGWKISSYVGHWILYRKDLYDVSVILSAISREDSWLAVLGW